MGEKALEMGLSRTQMLTGCVRKGDFNCRGGEPVIQREEREITIRAFEKVIRQHDFASLLKMHILSVSICTHCMY